MTYLGRDFSSFQGNLTPADVAGIDFAYVKVSEGKDYANEYAPQQVATLNAAGVKVGHYHFFDDAVDVLDQLHNFQLQSATVGGSSLPPVVDCEQQDPGGWNALASKLMDFVTNVEGWTYPVSHPRCMIYVDLTFDDNLSAADHFPWGRWVWLADPSHQSPSLPCRVWQNGEATLSDGKTIDTDVFIGSDADWAEFINETAPQEKPVMVATESQPISFAGQENVLSVFAGKLYREYDDGGTWQKVDLAVKSGNPAAQAVTFFDQAPRAALSKDQTQLLVTVEDSNYRTWFFAINQDGSVGVNELP